MSRTVTRLAPALVAAAVLAPAGAAASASATGVTASRVSATGVAAERVQAGSASVPAASVPAVSVPAASVPAVTTPVRFVIGRSVKGRPIYAYRVGNPRSLKKRVVIGQVHGEEKAGYRAAQLLLSDPEPRDMDLYVVPTANPDGYAANTRQNAHGVDINRNFPVNWKAVERPGGKHYQGPRPLSEPESRALMTFLDRIRPYRVVILHQPLDGVDTEGMKDKAFVSRLVSATGLRPKTFNCWGMCRGTVAQWFNKVHVGALVTVEFPAAPPASQVRRVATGVITAMRPR